MHAKIVWSGNVRFTATADSGHAVAMDGPPGAGGASDGAGPMELMLMGLGGCSSFEVVTILAKARQDVVNCVTEIDAEQAAEVPRTFTRIHLHFTVTGRRLDGNKVARAVSLAVDKYCPAAVMLRRGGVTISHDCEVMAAGDA